MIRYLFGLLLAVWIGLGTGEAVAAENVKVGDRIRIRAPGLTETLPPELVQEKKISPFASERFLLGTVAGVENRVLILRVDENDLPVPVEVIESAEIWAPGHHGFTLGFLGVVGGAVIGGFIGKSLEKEPSADCEFVCDLEFKTVEGAFIGGLAGGLIGYAIGKTMRRSRWEEASLGSLRAGIGLDGGKPGLMVSVSF